MRFFVCLAFTMVLAPAAWAQSGEEDHGAAVEKMNAYVGFMNRAIRASDSLSRYESWVNMKKGPTGKERIIYGLYAPYDVRTEIAKAEEATGAEPKIPDLDAAMTRFIAVYKELAPVLEKASKYYDRSDYKSDKMQGGKEFHAQIIKLRMNFQRHEPRPTRFWPREASNRLAGIGRRWRKPRARNPAGRCVTS